MASTGALAATGAAKQSDEGPEIQPGEGTRAEAEQPSHGGHCRRRGQEPAADDHGTVPEVRHTQGMPSTSCTSSTFWLLHLMVSRVGVLTTRAHRVGAAQLLFRGTLHSIASCLFQTCSCCFA